LRPGFPLRRPAPDIAGKNIANPSSLIGSPAMLLAWLGERRESPTRARPQRINAAPRCALFLKAGMRSVNRRSDRGLEADIGGRNTIVACLSSNKVHGNFEKSFDFTSVRPALISLTFGRMNFPKTY
jgi:hypothetical protein